MKFSLSILILFLFFSCVTEKKRAKICATCPVIKEEVTTKKDSSWKTESIKTFTVYTSVPGPTIVVPGPCDKLCDENGKLKPFYQETKKNGIVSKIHTDTIKNQLVVDCNEDSLARIIEEKTIENNRLIQESKVTKETKIVKVNELTWWQQLFIKCGYLFWLILIIFGGYKSVKFYLKTKL